MNHIKLRIFGAAAVGLGVFGIWNTYTHSREVDCNASRERLATWGYMATLTGEPQARQQVSAHQARVDECREEGR